jgi:hypothetical protein
MSALQDLTTKRAGGRLRWEHIPLFLLLAVVTFSFPLKPSADLDSSWRMALGRVFLDHEQFGRDVVFTYGPLGFLMGRTYSGLLYWSLLAWSLFTACSFAVLIQYWGQRLQSNWSRVFYYGFFLLFGVTYEDSIQMLVIALIGLELTRRTDRPWHWSSTLMLVLLALQSAAKFTNLMVAALAVLVGAALALWQGRRGNAVRLLAWFGGAFLAVWMLCGQSPLNLPAYLINSWHVSQGYQEVMGIPTPDTPFYRALVVMALLAGYFVLNFFTQADRPRYVARALIVGALVYLNWKHGFVRADGHMIGFFYCALLPIVGFPVLLEDAAPFPRLKRWGLAAAGLLCLLGVRDAIPPLVDSSLAVFQNRIWSNVRTFSQISTLREEYDRALGQQLERYGMPRTKAAVGDHSLDVIGYDLAAAIYNQFNYRPRPVFQSYSAYTPELARLNEAYYLSDRAPDFVLLRISPIDERLGAMDDSAVLCILAQRYEYVLTERSYQLWARKPGPFRAPPRPVLARRDLASEEAWSIKEYQGQPLWVTIDLRPSLLGRLRTFFYKPPILRLAITDASGHTSTYRMPAPIGRAGFIINPVIDDLMGFTRLASDNPERLASAIMLTLAPEDRKYFAAKAHAELASLPTSTAAKNYFAQLNQEVFYMFKTPPSSYDTNTKPSIQQIDGTDVMVMHAPSEMIFDLPANATTLSGRHGYVAGAYTDSGKTNGGDFVITWSDGRNSIEIYRRFLNPLTKVEDRGLLSFQLDLTPYKGGRLYFRTLPGPFNDKGWDWTAWTDIEVK